MERRSLLKAGAFIVSALPFTRLQAQSTKQHKLRIAVVGLGFFSGYVMPRIQASQHSKITALISADKEKAKVTAETFGVKASHILTYGEIGKLAEYEDVDAVYIATPVGTHAEFAIAALNAGKHVMVEKTMASTSDQAKEMIHIAATKNLKLMVAYRARYEPFNQQLIEWSKNQTYGAVRHISAHKGFNIGERFGKNNWRIDKSLAGGGALFDIGIYSLQACRYISDSEVKKVSAFISPTQNSSFKEVEDHISFNIEFKNGVLGTGSASWGYELQNFYKVGTEQATLELNPATSNQNLRLFVTTQGPRQRTERFLRNIDQIDAQFGHFADAIFNDTQVLTSGEEGLKDMLLIEAIYKSAREGKVITLG